MGMLKSIELENYKCFKDKTIVDIAPLTVLCGVNSSGKSSILKSLLMMKQTADSKFQDFSLAFSGDWVDCGNFDSVLYNGSDRNNNTFSITNEFQIRNHKLSAIGRYVKKEDAKFFNELRRMYDSIGGEIKSFIFKVNIIVEKNTFDTNTFNNYFVDNRIKNYSINISAIDENDSVIDACNGLICIENSDDNEHHLLSWENIPGFYRAKNSFENYICTCSFIGLGISNIFAYNMPNNVKSIVPNIIAISRIVNAQYESILYIAPLRNTPERTYLINKNVDSVGIAGQDTPVLLAKLKDKTILSDMFCPYDLNNNLIPDNYGYVTCDYLSIVQQWLNYFGIGKLSVNGGKRTINLEIGKQNITDVGFGISQLLPIITQGVYMDKNQTLLIEQPEIHLHPKMELQMADFLIHMAMTDRNVIVETHSDHIINRLVRRVLEDDTHSLYTKIKIYFIEQNNKNGNMSSILNEVPINDEYGIQKYPADFFDQSANEQLKMMQSGLLKRQKIRDKII